jgi:large subunit ribosomal protein L4
MNREILLEENKKNKKSIGLIHKVYVAQLKNSRDYTASTKTKSEVRGGGKKPWRQKGTGNARAGSIRSPLWVGGGVSFGPKPRNVYKKINKKEKRLAIVSALYLKNKNLIEFDENSIVHFENIKTKNVINSFSQINIDFKTKTLIILSAPNKKFWLASRNLGNVEITSINCVNLKQILESDKILISKSSLDTINFKYGKTNK